MDRCGMCGGEEVRSEGCVEGVEGVEGVECVECVEGVEGVECVEGVEGVEGLMAGGGEMGERKQSGVGGETAR